MKRRSFLIAAGLCGCARDRRPRLNVYNWSNYAAPNTIPRFEAEHGIRVRYGTYESNEEMLAKVMTGNSGWDIVFPTHSRLLAMLENKLLARLRHEWLPNLVHLDARFRSPTWDPDLSWCVPYMWNATGIIYDRSIVPAPASWADLWNERFRGRMTMLDDPEDVLGACLEKLRLPFSATDAGDLRRAALEARRQKPLLRAYLNAEVRDQLVAGDVLVAQLWSTTAQQAIDAAPRLNFAYPSEGFPVYMDNAVILRESRRLETAHRFLNYLLRPEVSAEIADFTRTATANGAARALLPAAIRENPLLYPPADIFARAVWPQPLSVDTQRLRDRLWTEIKAS